MHQIHFGYLIIVFSLFFFFKLFSFMISRIPDYRTAAQYSQPNDDFQMLEDNDFY